MKKYLPMGYTCPQYLFMVVEYTGNLDDVCPISFTPVNEILHPVGFDAKHAFECDMIVMWLTKHKARNPFTSLEVNGPVASVLHPLIIAGDDSHVQETTGMLQRAGYIGAKRHERIRRSMYWNMGNMVMFFCAVASGSALIIYMAISFLLAHLLYQTRKTYPRDGMQVIAMCLNIALDLLVITGIQKESSLLNLTTRLEIAYFGLLSTRLLLDIRQYIF